MGNHRMGHIYYFSLVMLGEIVDGCKINLLRNRTSATAFVREGGWLLIPLRIFQVLHFSRKRSHWKKTTLASVAVVISM